MYTYMYFQAYSLYIIAKLFLCLPSFSFVVLLVVNLYLYLELLTATDKFLVVVNIVCQKFDSDFEND